MRISPGLIRKATASHDKFLLVTAMLAARSIYESGVAVEEIARQAHKSPGTIRRWLRTADARRPK